MEFQKEPSNRNPLTILTIFGTRPEVIKLAPVIEKMREIREIDSIVVSTSQHRQMIEDLIRLFSIKVDYDLKIMTADQSLADISVRALSALDSLIQRHRPNMVIIQGDTTTAFIGALAAFYHKTPVGHVEAGLRSFDKFNPYPEEMNRKMISFITDLHFAPTGQNAQNLYKEQIDPSRVFVTGNTVIDSLLSVVHKKNQTLNRYLPMDMMNSQRLILVTAHRRENWGGPLENLCCALKDLVRSFRDIEIVYPVHLNPNVRKTVFAILGHEERIHLLDPLPYEPFVEAMAKAYLIVTDSGGIQEEGPSLRKPILVFRKVTERPEGFSTGGVKLTGVERESVVREASFLLENDTAYHNMLADHNPYGDGGAAGRIVQSILHYFGLADRPSDFSSVHSDY